MLGKAAGAILRETEGVYLCVDQDGWKHLPSTLPPSALLMTSVLAGGTNIPQNERLFSCDMSAALGLSVEKLLIPKIQLLSLPYKQKHRGDMWFRIKSIWGKQSHVRNEFQVEKEYICCLLQRGEHQNLQKSTMGWLTLLKMMCISSVHFPKRSETCITGRI